MTRHPDVVVVGAGIIGLASALELARSGRRVLVIDKAMAGRGASWAGGGILSTLPPDQCDPALKPLLDDSLAGYARWCAELHEASGVDPEYWSCGARQFDAQGREIAAFPGVAQVRNPRVLHALRLTAERHGVELREQLEVQGFEGRGERLQAVRTASGPIACEAAVIAAGAWSGALSGLPVRPVRGQMLLLDGGGDAPAEIRLADKVYVVPRRDGQVLVGSTLEEVGFDASVTTAAREELLARAAPLWPAVHRRPVLRQWSGLRPALPDGLPVIGPAPALRGLYCNTGHFRLGLTLAPGSARRLARAMAEGDG